MLRRLHDADALVPEQRHRPRQELWRRNEVGIENRDELRRLGQRGKSRQCVVYVSGLGMRVVAAREVAAAVPLAELLEPRPPAVVADPHPEVGIAHRHRPDDRLLEDRLLLIVGADQHVDQGQLRSLEQPRQIGLHVRAATPGARHEAERDRGRDQREPLDAGEHHSGDPVRGEAERRQRLPDTPCHVAPGEHDGDAEHEGACNRAVAAQPGQRRDHETGRHRSWPGAIRDRGLDWAHGLLTGTTPADPEPSPNTTRPVRPSWQVGDWVSAGIATVTR